MLFGQDRNQLRSYYADVLKKLKQGQPLTPLEEQIAAVLQAHPEYQNLLGSSEQMLGKEYLPEFGQTNPFLHMGLHLGLREQIATNRPAGIRKLMQRLLRKMQDPHATEHAAMELLAEAIWQAQRDGQPPDDNRYLAKLKQLVKQRS